MWVDLVVTLDRVLIDNCGVRRDRRGFVGETWDMDWSHFAGETWDINWTGFKYHSQDIPTVQFQY